MVNKDKNYKEDVSKSIVGIRQKIIDSLKGKIREKVKKKVIKTNNLKKKYSKSEFNPLERIRSGIPGFDELCDGGFAKNSINLLGGDAGSGKSLFAMQFIVNGITEYGENGVYISFEESKTVVFERMKQYGWDLQKLEDEKSFVYLQYTPEQVEQVLESGGGIIADVVLSIGAKRVVFDSLTAFTFLFDSEFKQRSALLSLFSLIRKWGCTALLIAEEEPDLKAHKANIMEFESDCDILVYNLLIENKREHVIEIYKMRGTNHSRNIYPFRIDTKGITINNAVYITQM
jgi:KaiC/GvpD/RAD55 family RecA-like ATPase